MKNFGGYTIELEKGEANRPFDELTEEERRQIGNQVFREVTLLASKFGLTPVTTRTISRLKKK